MKSLKQYIQDDLFATPMNTTGMGNIGAPENSIVGSGDIIEPLCLDIKTGKIKRKKKKFKRYKI